MKRSNPKKQLVGLFFLVLTIITFTVLIQSNNQKISAATAHSINYTQNDWGTGATVNITITNNDSTPVNGWVLEWQFSGNQKITNMWNASFIQNGTSVTTHNLSYNSTIPANGGTVSFGFNLSYSGSNFKPTSFILNGNAIGAPLPTPTVTATVTLTPTATQIPTPTPTPTTTLIPTIMPSGLPVPAGNGNVPRPTGTPGNLTVINWAGFKGAVSYTFDDANSSQIAHYPELKALGVPMTFCLTTNKSEAASSTWAQALKDGHELGNHTQTHPATATASDIDACTTFIEQQFGVTPLTMAAPYGDMSYVSFAQSRFLLNRGVWGGSIAPNDNTDPYNLLCHIPATSASASTMTSVVNTARAKGNWQIMLIHGFTGGTDYAYQPVDIDQFTQSVNDVKAFGDMWIDSVINIGSYWRAQKLFASISPKTIGSDIVYEWTLPAHFPKGKYLRVKVTGGTLKQNNQVLNWDSHGYYEIALDAGSLYITP
ncbi:MAG TPA: cellulose binding domain-containing protein [Bacillota bacterium]|nr:cellulose binding domain-containing protein [Bacillota bacterium]